MYPNITIDTHKFRQNVKAVRHLCQKFNIEITGITKCVCGDVRIAKIIYDEGIEHLGDSRIANLYPLKDIPIKKWLIRSPMATEVDDVVKYADVSLNAELYIIDKLNSAARQQKKRHKIILMADLGDLREGYANYSELINTAVLVEKMDSIDLYGIGANLGCLSFVQPDADKMKTLEFIAVEVEHRIKRKLDIISAGNSSSLCLMLKNGMPHKINNLRLGESLLFGRERAHYQYLPSTCKDAFILHCQIIELKVKPSIPWGTIGGDSYGKLPEFINRGEKRLRAICSVGRQDFDLETSLPVDPGIHVVGCSSDHLVLDVSDSRKQYKLGDVIDLVLGYHSLMRAYTSKYVDKIYL